MGMAGRRRALCSMWLAWVGSFRVRFNAPGGGRGISRRGELSAAVAQAAERRTPAVGWSRPSRPRAANAGLCSEQAVKARGRGVDGQARADMEVAGEG